MSIHCIATKNGKPLAIERGTKGVMVRLLDDDLDKEFEFAAKGVKAIAMGNCDYFLRFGALNSHAAAFALEIAIGETDYDGVAAERVLSPDEVRAAGRSVNWGFTPPNAAIKGAWWSAREFLRLCVKHGLGIRIEW